MKKRYDFTKQEKDGAIKKVGYLDMESNEECASMYFYGDIISSSYKWEQEDRCPQEIADFMNSISADAPINVYFNSGGGDVYAGIAIYNILMRHKGKKTGYNDALAASITSVILCAMDEIITNAGAQVMVHKPWTFDYGNANDFRKTIEELDKCEENIIDIYMTKTKEGVTREEIATFVNNEKWFNGTEFAEYFKTELNDTQPAQACASSTLFDRYKKAPKKSMSLEEIDVLINNAIDLKLAKIEKENTDKSVAELTDDLYLYGI